jgi:hypothetical protein
LLVRFLSCLFDGVNRWSWFSFIYFHCWKYSSWSFSFQLLMSTVDGLTCNVHTWQDNASCMCYLSSCSWLDDVNTWLLKMENIINHIVVIISIGNYAWLGQGKVYFAYPFPSCFGGIDVMVEKIRPHEKKKRISLCVAASYYNSG